MSEMVRGARSRAPNFTRQNQLLLFDAMKPYTHIIESKQTDSVKQADKQIAWAKITEMYNSKAVGQPRTTANLISLYRNLKSKLKKQHSEGNVLLVDPAQRALIKDEDGKDWQKVAATSNWNDHNLCDKGSEEFKKEIQNEEERKKFMMGIGGPDKNEDECLEIKLEPQIDFTIYDGGDTELMAQYHQTILEAERMQPIEKPFIECTTIIKESSPEQNTPQKNKSSKTLPKNKEPALSLNETTGRKTKSVNESFKQLAKAKLELVQMQKLVLEKEFAHKQRLQEIEIEEIIKENKFKEKMREKELELMDIKTNNARNMIK